MVLFVSIIKTRQHCLVLTMSNNVNASHLYTFFLSLFFSPSSLLLLTLERQTSKLLITCLLTCSRSTTDTNNCLSEFIADLFIRLCHGVDPNTEHSRATCRRWCSERWWLSPKGELMERTWPTTSASNHLQSRQSGNGAFTLVSYTYGSSMLAFWSSQVINNGIMKYIMCFINMTYDQLVGSEWYFRKAPRWRTIEKARNVNSTPTQNTLHVCGS